MSRAEPIQIWEHHEPISLDKVSIKIDNSKRQKLPDDVEARVYANWEAFKAKRKNAADNDIAYLVSYELGLGVVNAGVFTAGYRYNQWFNRDDKEGIDTDISNKLNYNPFSSWIILTCDSGKQALFGNKRDFGDRKVSGFGGFSTSEDVVCDTIDAERWMKRKLLEEFGPVEKVLGDDAIKNFGLSYYPCVGAKGFDGLYVAELEGSPAELEKLFKESPQFSKQLMPVNSDPKNLMAFLEDTGWEPTPSCVGGVLAYIGARYGPDELNKQLSGYSMKKDVCIL